MYSLYLDADGGYIQYSVHTIEHAKDQIGSSSFFFLLSLPALFISSVCWLQQKWKEGNVFLFCFFCGHLLMSTWPSKRSDTSKMAGDEVLGGWREGEIRVKKETTKEIVFHGLAGWRPTQSAWKNICPFKAFTNSYIYAWTLHFGLLMVSWSWKYIYKKKLFSFWREA